MNFSEQFVKKNQWLGRLSEVKAKKMKGLYSTNKKNMLSRAGPQLKPLPVPSFFKLVRDLVSLRDRSNHSYLIMIIISVAEPEPLM